jgi:hypothetical protein
MSNTDPRKQWKYTQVLAKDKQFMFLIRHHCIFHHNIMKHFYFNLLRLCHELLRVINVFPYLPVPQEIRVLLKKETQYVLSSL